MKNLALAITAFAAATAPALAHDHPVDHGHAAGLVVYALPSGLLVAALLVGAFAVLRSRDRGRRSRRGPDA